MTSLNIKHRNNFLDIKNYIIISLKLMSKYLAALATCVRTEEASIMMRFIISGHQICNMVYRDSEYNDYGFDRCEGLQLQYLTVMP